MNSPGGAIAGGFATTRITAPAGAPTRRRVGLLFAQEAIDRDDDTAQEALAEIVAMLGLNAGNTAPTGRLAPVTQPRLISRNPTTRRAGVDAGQRQPILHGTPDGYRRHIWLTETPCKACSNANSRAASDLRKALGEQPQDRFVEPLESRRSS